MQVEQLSNEAQSKLQEVLQAIEQLLKTAKTPHLRLVSQSSMPEGPKSGVYNGGSVVAPSKPQLSYDERPITKLHQAFLRSAEEVLFGVIVIAERPNAETGWQLRTKLVSRDEQRALEQARKSIDSQVEAELGAHAHGDWERVSYGRDVRDKPVKAIRRSSAGAENFEPTARLVALLDEAGAIYRKKDLDLQIAYWTLRPSGLEFREYYE